MLHTLKIKNFSSFREEQEFSLLGTKSTHNDRRFMMTPSGKNVTRVAMIYGANASGKSNFLRALGFVSWFITSSWKALDQGEEIPFSPFLFTKKNHEPTEFEIHSEDQKGTCYIYYLKLTTKKVIQESLRIRKKEDSRTSLIFMRNEENYKIYPRAQFLFKDIPQAALRENISFLSSIKKTNISVFKDFFESIQSIVNIDSQFNFIVKNVSANLKALDKNDDSKKFVEEQLKKIDLGISGIEIKKERLPEEIAQKISRFVGSFAPPPKEDDFNTYEAHVYHNIGGKKYKLKLEQESNGTQKAIPLLTEIFMTLSKGGLFVYDEIEYALHPLLLQFLLELFYDEDSNPHGAQLICSCHATDSMNFLHKSQIFLAEKNDDQESSLIRLSDMIGIRNSDNLMQKYLSGTYGGVPCL